MNVGEATAVNTVLRYLLDLPQPMGSVPAAADVRSAAIRLAERANKTLAAGLGSEDVAQAWPVPMMHACDGTAPEAPRVRHADAHAR